MQEKTHCKKTIKLSDIIEIDNRHIDAFLCSSKHLWNKDSSLKTEAINGLPKNFRIVNHDTIEFSASGIFTSNQFTNALKEIYSTRDNIKKIYVVDLLKEYHGFIQSEVGISIPFSFRAHHNTVNFGVECTDILENENIIIKNLQNQFKNKKISIISKFETTEGGISIIEELSTLTCNKVISETSLIELYNIPQVEIIPIRLPNADHQKASVYSIVNFAFLVEKINPQTDWLHLHCHGGKGRSTSYSVLYEIFYKAMHYDLKDTSINEILKAHHRDGGSDLQKFTCDEWKREFAIDRFNLLKYIFNISNEINLHNLQSIFAISLDICLKYYDVNMTKEAIKDAIKDYIVNDNIAAIVNDDAMINNLVALHDQIHQEYLENSDYIDKLFYVNNEAYSDCNYETQNVLIVGEEDCNTTNGEN